LSEQRERLISAAALTIVGGQPPTIAALVKLARVSRNTFYEYFDDLEHARHAAMQRANQRLDQALRRAELTARTPVERWRALVHAWFDWIALEPAEARLVLDARASALSEAGSIFQAALGRSIVDLRVFGVRPAGADTTRQVAVAAAGEAFGREWASKWLAAGEQASTARDREPVERALVEIAVRVLR
jgi:AcrR family transcriptional regulator